MVEDIMMVKEKVFSRVAEKNKTGNHKRTATGSISSVCLLLSSGGDRMQHVTQVFYHQATPQPMNATFLALLLHVVREYLIPKDYYFEDDLKHTHCCQ